MTEAFKNKLLKFICGKLELDDISNIPNFQEIKSINNNLNSYLKVNFSEGYYIKGSLEVEDFIAVYGYYMLSNNTKGFIILFDRDFNILKNLKQFSSGTDFSEFMILEKDEKNQIFGIDNKNGVKRFIMLNYFFLKSDGDYKVILRQSYNLQSYTQQANNFTLLRKNPIASEYLIFSTVPDENYVNNLLVTLLKIKVGSENEWNEFLTNEYPYFLTTDAIVNWQEDNLNFICCGFKSSNGMNYYTEIKFSNNSFTNFYVSSEIANMKSADGKIISENESFYAISQTSNSKETFSIFHKKNNIVSLIYTDVADFISLPSKISLKKVDYKIFYIIYKTISQDVNDSTLEIKIGSILENNEIIEEQVCEAQISELVGLNVFIINKENNKYNFYVQVANQCNTTYYVKSELNVLDELNCLKPSYVNIYNNTNELLFSKNLYNLSTNENVIMATANIENSVLNDIDLIKQTLVSETNLEMLQEAKSIEKNIYENLFINFIYSYIFNNENIVKSELNPDLNKKLVNSIMNKKYKDFYVNKVKLIFSDNSFESINISNITINENVATITSVFKANKDIKQIQICNNNLDIIFLNIDINLVSQKYYKISQKIEVM